MIIRLKRLRAHLKKEGHFPYLIFDLINIKYLTGFTGSNAYLLIDKRETYFITDSRYEEYARSILPESITLVLQQGDFFDSLKKIIPRTGTRSLYIEEHSVTLSTFITMKKRLRGTKIIQGGAPVNELRSVKDDVEVVLLKKAARIADRLISHLKGIIKPGIREWDIAVEIEHFYRTNGCSKSSFEAIVASGPGSSMPHYQTSMTRRIHKGDALLVDTGCTYQEYNSDITRTFLLEGYKPELKEIYSIVKRAQEAAVSAVRPGIRVGKLDSTARGIISAEGYGDYFGHSLGHGVGLEVHELPAVKDGDFRLKKNMVITIEPGIYIPGLGGVRIEDMVLVTPQGGVVLTGSSKKLQVV